MVIRLWKGVIKVKTIHISYTILETIEVEDSTTPDEIESLIEDDMWEKGIVPYVNEYEWHYG